MVFLPLSDDAAPHEGRAFVTLTLIALTVAVFLWRFWATGGADLAFQLRWGVVPAVAEGAFGGDAFVRGAPFVTYMFLHAGWAHLFVNMLFLWIFGDDVEHATGPARFLALYTLCGVAGAAAQVALGPRWAAPLVGASAAVAGVMGAYLMIRPCAKVKVLVIVVVVRILAVWLIVGWGAMQVSRALAADDAPVAWWAHVGGLVAGALLIPILKRKDIRLLQCRQTGAGAVGPARRGGRPLDG